MSEFLKVFTDDNFTNEVVESSVPVVVDFWAEWCGPCKMLTPIMEDLAKDYEGKVIIGKVNIDENPQVASKYNIISIPTLLFFKNGSIVEQHTGLLPKAPLKAKIDRAFQ